MLTGFGYEVADIPVDLATRVNPMVAAVEGLTLARRFHLHLALSHAPWLANRVRGIRAYLRERSDVARLVILESHQDYPVAIAAWQEGCRVIALPHNLESFCNVTDLAGVALPQSFENELTILRRCDAVYPISYEEAWLLTLQGVDCTPLLYRVPTTLRSELQRIRATRSEVAATTDAPYLILGSAINAFSRAGMEQLLDWLTPALETGTIRLDIAGFGTEQLAHKLPAGPHLRLHGPVSHEQRDALLSKCRALLVHQIAGAGALTRIVEALDAGVPVIANRMASRSANYPDVQTYDDSAALLRILKNPLMPNLSETTPDIDGSVEHLKQRIRHYLS